MHDEAWLVDIFLDVDVFPVGADDLPFVSPVGQNDHHRHVRVPAIDTESQSSQQNIQCGIFFMKKPTSECQSYYPAITQQ